MRGALLRESSAAIDTAFAGVESAGRALELVATYKPHLVCDYQDLNLQHIAYMTRAQAITNLNRAMAHFNNTVLNNSILVLGPDHPGIDTRF